MAQLPTPDDESEPYLGAGVGLKILFQTEFLVS